MKRRILLLVCIVMVSAAAATAFLKSAYVIPVIMYHSIDHNDKVTKLSVSPEDFERQMKFLYDRHYNVVGLDKVIRYMRKEERVPPKTIAVTFDDGFYNNYQYAYPVLKKYNLPAAIFVIVDKIGTQDEYRWMGWSELKEMSDSGIVTIGSHTMSHRWLPSLGTRELTRELVRSKEILGAALDRKVEFLCYPLGAFDERVKEAAQGAGYSAAVTTNHGVKAPSDDIYAIKRIRISRTSGNLLTFWFETSGYYTWIKEHRDD